MEVSDYERKRLKQLRESLSEDAWEWLWEFVSRAEREAWTRGRDAQYQAQGGTVTIRRERDERGIIDKGFDFIFGE